MLISCTGRRLPGCPGGAPVGEAAALFLRPERIAIGSDGGAAGGGATVTGDVVEAVFVGEAMRYVVRAGGGETFTVKRLNLDTADRFKVGARVTLRWDPDAAFTQRRDP